MQRISVQTEAFDVNAEIAALSSASGADAGGISAFIGAVRGGDDLVSLTLEHYPGMTDAALSTIAEDVVHRHQLLGCTIVHRVGCLGVGDQIVLVLAAARHRGAALAAVETMIDWLKTRAPFWKCETFADGTTRWVEARNADDAAAARWDA